MDVKELREKAGVTQEELAAATGIPRDRIAKWEQGKGSPKPIDYNILKTYFQEHQGEFLPTAAQKSIRKPKVEINPYLVPFVDVPAQAGYTKAYGNIGYIQTLKQFPILPDVDPHGAVWRYFQVEGDSMAEEIRDKDVILASQVPKEDWELARDYYTHVIVTDENLWIKDIYKESAEAWILLSANPVYEPFRVSLADVKQLWVLRRHIKARVSKPQKYDIEALKKKIKKK